MVYWRMRKAPHKGKETSNDKANAEYLINNNNSNN